MELRSLIEIFWRKRKTFGIFFLIVFLTILIVSWRIQPSFDATTKVQIVKSTAISSFFKAINVESTSSGSTFDDSELQDYNTIVTSGPVIDEFIEKLELKRERKWVQLIKMVPLTGPIIKAVGLQDNAMKPIAREELTNPGFLNLLFPSPSVKTELAD
ncbi:hypothetical protein BVX94_00565, partial [bacterium B17]